MAGLPVPVRKNHILGQRSVKAGRLVHIVPDSPDALIQQETLFLSPPLSHCRIAEVRKRGVTGPHCVDVYFPLGRFRKISLFNALVIYAITRLLFYPRIVDDHWLKSPLCQRLQISRRVSVIPLFIPGKHAVFLHIVNIKMDGVTGDIPLPHTSGDLLHILQSHISPSGLMVAQCPFLRQRTGSREIGIVGKYLRHGVSRHIVIVQISCRRAEIIVLPGLLSHIKKALAGIVQKNAVHMLPRQCHKKGNGLIQRLKAVHLGVWIVGIPHLIVIAALVKESGLVSQTVKMFVPA